MTAWQQRKHLIYVTRQPNVDMPGDSLKFLTSRSPDVRETIAATSHDRVQQMTRSMAKSDIG